MNVLGHNIRRLRLEAGLSEEELAGKLAISAELLTDWEEGRNWPRSGLLIAMAEIFDVSVAEFLLLPGEVR